MNRSRDLEATLERLERFGVRLGLETTRRLLEALGNPQLEYPCVLVAGTNGKGSTSALLASMAVASGYRTGLYTSPHLETLEERIRIDGVGIDRATLEPIVSRVVEAADRVLGHAPTYFEALTVAACDHFARSKVDLAVLEVGLGGRLDSTNACEPILSLITDIGLEHQVHLGNSLDAIAREKAGILRQGTPAVGWLAHREARRAIRDHAQSIGAELLVGSEVTAIDAVGDDGSLGGQTMVVSTPNRRYGITTPLAGDFQRANVALAVLAAEKLGAESFPRLSAEAIVRGAATVYWPGRMERVVVKQQSPVLLDAAHNPDAAGALRRQLDRMQSSYVLLFGSLNDKEVGSILPPLARRAARVVLTEPSSPRAYPAAELRPLIGGDSITIEPEARQALTNALQPGCDLTVICGSVYLVGELRRELRRRFGVPAPTV